METDLQNTDVTPEVAGKYSITDNTFTVTGDNPMDLIVAEIGDSKQPDKFHPRLKVSRWDNRANMSIGLLHDDVAGSAITTDGEKIRYDRQKFTADFYELAPQAQAGLEEGGYEFEITLKEKPVSNVINFSIRTKGVKFLYQPELTQEEKDAGFERPDEIVGSYAIYYDNDFVNIIGGREYKCGKVGHINRPKIIDSLGVEEWGELNIDPVAETLTVTIPQDFLDGATYPINHAAGLTFGYTSIGSSSGGAASNFIFAHPIYTPAFDGLAQSISVYYTGVVGGAKSTVGLYDTIAADYPDNLIGGTAEITNTNDAWNVLSLSGEAVTNGPFYRIGIQLGVANSRMKYDASGGFKDYFKSHTYAAGAMPDPFPAAASAEFPGQWSSYVTYILAATTPPPIFFWN